MRGGLVLEREYVPRMRESDAFYVYLRIDGEKKVSLSCFCGLKGEFCVTKNNDRKEGGEVLFPYCICILEKHAFLCICLQPYATRRFSRACFKRLFFSITCLSGFSLPFRLKIAPPFQLLEPYF